MFHGHYATPGRPEQAQQYQRQLQVAVACLRGRRQFRPRQPDGRGGGLRRGHYAKQATSYGQRGRRDG
jgi:hypothetical protein